MNSISCSDKENLTFLVARGKQYTDGKKIVVENWNIQYPLSNGGGWYPLSTKLIGIYDVARNKKIQFLNE